MMTFGFGYGALGWLGLVFRGVMCLAVIALIVWFIIWAVRRGRTHPTYPPVLGPTPKEIAQLRYAKGEITQAEYKKIIADLDK